MTNFKKTNMNVKKFSSNPSLSIVLLGIIITSLFTLLLFLTNILEFNNVWAATGGTAIPTYMISTRDGSDPPKGVQEIGYNGKPLGDINQLRRIVLLKLQFLSMGGILTKIRQRRDLIE